MITTTFDNKDEANKISELLLKERLVSCCQLSNITSSYHWKGKIEHTEEYLLQMKSKKELYKEIEKVILDNHSYETPQLIAYDITYGYKGYLDWIEEETK
jgi:periplasmic divalent cation tolerance protein